MHSAAVLPRSSLLLKCALLRARRKRLPLAWAVEWVAWVAWAAWAAWDSKVSSPRHCPFRRHRQIHYINENVPTYIGKNQRTSRTHHALPSPLLHLHTIQIVRLLGYHGYELVYRYLRRAWFALIGYWKIEIESPLLQRSCNLKYERWYLILQRKVCPSRKRAWMESSPLGWTPQKLGNMSFKCRCKGNLLWSAMD
jgi:hypothetical protein